MKRNQRNFAVLLTGLTLVLVSGCSSTQTADCYSLDKGTLYGDYILHANMTLSQGDITACSLEETYSPCVWARVDPNEKSDSTIETLEVDDAYLFDGTQGKVYFAKYIQIGDFTLTGSLRSEDDDYDAPLLGRGEYVKYTIDSISDGSTTPNDLYKYLAVSDTDTYKLGSRYNWYFNAVKDGNIHAWGQAKTSEESSEASEDASSSEEPSLVRDVDYTLAFPGDSTTRNGYSVNADWVSSVNGFLSFLVEIKQLNYVYKSTDSNNNDYKCLKVDTSDKTYLYNPDYAQGIFSDDNWERIEGCYSTAVALDSLKVYFDAMNRCYASEEYESKK
jgi:hypothetical protein